MKLVDQVVKTSEIKADWENKVGIQAANILIEYITEACENQKPDDLLGIMLYAARAFYVAAVLLGVNEDDCEKLLTEAKAMVHDADALPVVYDVDVEQE